MSVRADADIAADGWPATRCPDDGQGLIEAARFGDQEGVIRNIAKGALLECTDVDDKTPLMWAASEGWVEIVTLLVGAGADVNFANRHGSTALIEAALQGQERCVEVLLNSGADPNARERVLEATALMYASFIGHVEIAKSLLDHGAAVDAADKDGRTPLLEAAYIGHSPIVELLLERGAQVNATNKYGTTPLLTAHSKKLPPAAIKKVRNASSVSVKPHDGSRMQLRRGTG